MIPVARPVVGPLAQFFADVGQQLGLAVKVGEPQLGQLVARFRQPELLFAKTVALDLLVALPVLTAAP
jgi:hypothetical protein